MTKYALVVDESTQWTVRILSADDLTSIIGEIHDVYGLEHSDFIKNIYNRYPSFFSTKFMTSRETILNESFYGWYLSELEFNRIKKMKEILPTVDQFKKLASLD